MKRIYQFLTSMPFMGFLLLVFAISMAVATFTEASYGTEAAKSIIYNTHWFELVLVLLGFNLMVNFLSYKMYSARKIVIGLFHISFTIIIIGAGITRYASFEGVMHIREGMSSNTILSTDTYLTIEMAEQKLKTKVLFSELRSGTYSESIVVEGNLVKIKSVGFVKNAVKTPVENAAGEPLVDFVVSAGQGMQPFAFRKGETVNLGPVVVGYSPAANIRFEDEDDQLYIVSDRDLEIRSMSGAEPVSMVAGSRQPVLPMHLYAFDDYLLLVKQFYPHASVRVTPSTQGDTGEDAVLLELTDGERVATVNVFGRSGQVGQPTTYMLGNTAVAFSYGSELIKLPFSLLLKDFQLDRYIGSDSPSSFASEIELSDEERGVEEDHRIFMNNTLKYRGYRFYQSSYDQDELGTVLSVNKDFWGTFVTYLGYLLMTVGMILALFARNSYFRHLVRHLKELNKAAVAGLILFLLTLPNPVQANDAVLNAIPNLDQDLVSDFSELWVHGRDGRIEPMSTLNNEILRKLTRKASFEGKTADELVLSMNLFPELWRTVPLIKLEKAAAAKLGMTEKRASVLDFFDEQGQYRILEEVQAAYNKMPAMRDQRDKDYLTVDERLNICFMIFNGEFFTFFPPVNQKDAWYAAGSSPTGYPKGDSLFVASSFKLLRESLNPGGEIQPRQIMATIANFQQKFGADILPSDSKKELELFYNQYQPFKRVFPWYLLLGIGLLVVLFVNIIRQKTVSKPVRYIFGGLIFLAFGVHTVGLIVRWYISGHAPWSNGYESMIYVAWAAMLAGIIFGRKYPMVLATAAFLTGITLFVAHLNWMNPEITQLVPVLKSYWLLIHVAVITASYGFIGLSSFLGVLVLTLYALMHERNQQRVAYFTDQLTTISELSATLGLYMLTIGTFLGGVWANESWGRYWGWDPKETWALITVVIFAFIVHLRFIPGLRGRFHFNVATVVGFCSVLMTYFGVNYFLSGMHSYGKGSVEGVHWSVYAALIAVIVLIFAAYEKYRRYGQAEQ
ncbi:c-type cytochrome biogenesis protein CcsB [Mangrovibacterium marinum]|uniref:Cytochrome c-type biogenesis protein CcsB n=1 Tax=Mangrovibacterium marinum TaxID=1639118 RepID=A0A2T5BX61_9BACT|nr:c-type cytochrome biogenesis protein CcsB [Mangrovibacterium marinum]PTN04333.1 cytochrome c-type biogenesis protein CcsB [Mangrovibacterium marinum]